MRYTNKRQQEKNNSAHHAPAVTPKEEQQQREEFMAYCKTALHVRVWTDNATSSLWRLDQIRRKPRDFARVTGVGYHPETGFNYRELVGYVRKYKTYLK